MKKLLMVLAIGATVASCNNGANTTEEKADSAVSTLDSSVNATVDSAKASLDSTANAVVDSAKAKVDTLKK
jgi:hypothetical protein